MIMMLIEVTVTLKNLQSSIWVGTDVCVYSVTNPVILPTAMLGLKARKDPFYIIEIYF